MRQGLSTKWISILVLLKIRDYVQQIKDHATLRRVGILTRREAEVAIVEGQLSHGFPASQAGLTLATPVLAMFLGCDKRLVLVVTMFTHFLVKD